MKKLWFISAIVLYGVIGILGLMGHAYTEEASITKTAERNLAFLVLAAIVIGSIFFYFFKRIFPTGYFKQNQFARILIPALFIILPFALNRAWLQVINVIGTQHSLNIDGHIIDKKIERSGKTNFYYVVFVDSITENQYCFGVKKSVFDRVGNNGDKISRKFLIGSFGIIYRSKF